MYAKCSFRHYIGTIWKSSSSSECSGVLSGSWSLSELSGVNDRWQCTGRGEVHGELQCSVVAGQQGVVCAGSKDTCSMLETWCIHGVFHKGVGKSAVLELLS